MHTGTSGMEMHVDVSTSDGIQPAVSRNAFQYR